MACRRHWLPKLRCCTQCDDNDAALREEARKKENNEDDLLRAAQEKSDLERDLKRLRADMEKMIAHNRA
eukprot:9194535-Prorocentrum_lima.AAC.1